MTVLGTTFGAGRYLVDKLLQGKGLRQLYQGRDTATGATVMVSYDTLPKHLTIAKFVENTGARSPGVLDLVFAGPPDDDNKQDDDDPRFMWGVIEQPPPDSEWLPSVLGQHREESAADAVPQILPSFEPTRALPNAMRLGRTAGSILAANVAKGTLLTHVRPETMWIARGADGALEVRALSQRSELMFAASWVTAWVWPVFDRYYYPPEVAWKKPTIDDRSLVFSLSIMIAEWATGLYPFATKDYASGPLEDNQVPLVLPKRIAELLGAGMRIDPDERPRLTPFMAELEALDAASPAPG